MSGYVPKIGKVTKPPRTYQFESAKLDMLSFCTSPVEITGLGCSEFSTHATGFFWKHNDQSYLVTNWHVLTGLNPLTGERNSKALIPESVHFFCSTLSSADDNPSLFAPTRKRCRVELYQSDRARWYQHPNFEDERIDIAAIPLENVCRVDDACHVNQYGFQKLFHMVGGDVLIVGYPLGSYDGWMVPIWKRGSLATEPLVQIDDKPMFLVDAATTEGMSGSPMFRRVFGPAALADNSMKLDAVVTTEFVGVYAGNLMSSELGRINVGYGWYGRLVDEIVTAKIQGNSDIFETTR